MAQRRLYNPVVHYVYKAVTGGWFVAALGLAASAAARGSAVRVAVVAGPVLSLLGLVFYRTVWRACIVRATDTHLLVGRGPRPRRIRLEDLLTLERPAWAYLDRIFVPIEVGVRNGPPVLVIPDSEGEQFLRGRIVANRDTAVAASRAG